MKLRPVLQTLPAYVPGRTVPGAIKLASNETPYPPLPYVLDRIAQAAASANRYPDANSTELAAALAHRYGVGENQVAVGCGSVSLATQLVQAVADAGDEVVYAWRSFEAYPIIASVAGAASVQVPLTDEHTHDLPAMAKAVTDSTRLVIVCNPNNPTGTVVGADELRQFLQDVPPDVVVALDEAYREFVDPDATLDGLTLLDEHPNLVILRTFSKAYGLAGLRAGYAIAGDPAVAAAIKQTQVPFAVTTLAQQAALASLEEPATEQLHQRVTEVTAERRRLRHALHGVSGAGYEIPRSEANFLWFPLGDATTEWAAALEARGVIVRPFAGSGARVTVSSPEENDRFLSAAVELARG